MEDDVLCHFSGLYPANIQYLVRSNVLFSAVLLTVVKFNQLCDRWKKRKLYLVS